ncbi:MAG: LPS export ABC transporter periplasmic protein LptC [Methylophilaceae bacterium]
MNIHSTFFVFIFLIIIALTTFWLKEKVENEFINKPKNLNNTPDFYLKEFNVTQTNKDGKIKFTLNASSMKHYKYLDKALLNQPYYKQYKNERTHITIRSEKGEINNKGDEIFFNKNVVLTRLPTKQKKKLSLFTDELNIFTKLDIVTSKKSVKMIQEPNIEIDGIGMEYDKKEGITKLLSNVKVFYEKPNKKK